MFYISVIYTIDKQKERRGIGANATAAAGGVPPKIIKILDAEEME